jgi:hypothetical protein
VCQAQARMRTRGPTRLKALQGSTTLNPTGRSSRGGCRYQGQTESEMPEHQCMGDSKWLPGLTLTEAVFPVHLARLWPDPSKTAIVE